ncbi:hypothetical protein C5167_041271 [Papaver somniferum]|uniref:Uncharacterized protein n=1 Tax=Papaver somniferum TaxID=3469 RepID=A0A4Y7IJP2_PAPSO|nr:midasin-like [Papaver somniferum]XP_026428042.1 midasin-like [Papaver somniferum]XP_026428049.1 midasin-like [Papaver somniferum]XP_026428053.1 midasin-like [Papaver somniferum]RZC48316.1 hypothetical protein C5167_041271 [Papaver somniferum]
MEEVDQCIEQYENTNLGDTSAGSKNYTKQPIISPSRPRSKKHYVERLSYENVKSGDTSAGSKNSTKQLMYQTSQIQKQSPDEWEERYENFSFEEASYLTSQIQKQSPDERIGEWEEPYDLFGFGDEYAGSCKQPMCPTSQIQKQPTDEWKRRYENFSRAGAYVGSTRKPVCPTSQIQKQSIDLKVSLQMFLQEATTFADHWTDVNRTYDDRRSFDTFLWLLEMFGLDWRKYMSEDNDIYISNQPNRWLSLEASSDDVVQLFPETGPNSNWVIATKYYNGSLSLMELLQRIRSESGNDFSREQAGLLCSFLDHLIMIQQEQRVVACSFSKHLEQLRKSDAAASLAFSTNDVDDDGDRNMCPLILSEHTIDYSMWQQKHLFDSLYIISRESTWLLKKLKDSRFTSPSLIEESNKILEIIMDFIPKFKKSKELLGQYLLDNLLGYPFIEDESMQLMQENKEILYHFGNHIKDLQVKGVGRGSVIENILGCLGDVCNVLMDDYGELDSSSDGDFEFSWAVADTINLIERARKTLNPDRFSTLTGGSPLGNIAIWRILFESSLINLRLDLISKKHGEVIKLGVKVLDDTEEKSDLVATLLQWLHEKTSLLLSDGEGILLDFLAMHKTVAEITYMLGDAFTTGGAGMKELSGETSHGSSSTNDKETEMVLDFPWDKHNVLGYTEIDLNDPNTRLLGYPCCDFYGPDDDDGFDST